MSKRESQIKFLTEPPPAPIPVAVSVRLLPLVTEETYNEFMVGRKNPLAEEIAFIVQENPFLNQLALNMHKNISKFIHEKLEFAKRTNATTVLGPNGQPTRTIAAIPGLTVDEARELATQAIISTYCILHRQATKDHAPSDVLRHKQQPVDGSEFQSISHQTTDV